MRKELFSWMKAIRGRLHHRGGNSHATKPLCEPLEPRMLLSGSPGPAPAVDAVQDIATAAVFEWLPGATYSQGGSQALDDYFTSGGTVHNEFTTYFQTKLAAIKDTNGDVVFDPAANGVEVTVVAGFGEKIAFADPATNTVYFDFADGQPNEFLEIYFDTTPDADTVAGTGFNDGTLVLRADITDVPYSFFQVVGDPAAGDVAPLNLASPDFAGVLTVLGGGTTTLEAETTYRNASVFKIPVLSMRFDITSHTPFDTVTPSDSFVTMANPGTGDGPSPTSFNVGAGIPGVGVGFINGAGSLSGVGGPDITFQSEVVNTFIVAPRGVGFWANHTNLWVGFDPDDSFAATFGLEDIINPNSSWASMTLLEALNTNGGGNKALARQATAALLNAAHPNVDYAATTEQIIALPAFAYDYGMPGFVALTLQLANNGQPAALLVVLQWLDFVT